MFILRIRIFHRLDKVLRKAQGLLIVSVLLQPFFQLSFFTAIAS